MTPEQIDQNSPGNMSRSPLLSTQLITSERVMSAHTDQGGHPHPPPPTFKLLKDKLISNRAESNSTGGGGGGFSLLMQTGLYPPPTSHYPLGCFNDREIYGRVGRRSTLGFCPLPGGPPPPSASIPNQSEVKTTAP